jgi:CubicO group peptidase (beta-lactamase class C family)
MISRRTFTAGAGVALSISMLAPAMASDQRGLSDAIAGLDQLHSLQVQRGNTVIFAQAPRGRGLDGQANIKSCAKSIVGLLLGQAIAQGRIDGVGAKLADIAPALIPFGATEGVAELTMDHLVTMRAGLERTSGTNYGGWVASSNWIAGALRRPMIDRPGARMLYSTGTTHVLGAALAEASGETLLRLARAGLGDPMGFEIPPWVQDPQGFYLGGNEMALTPRAMLRVAVMVRDRGRFAGLQIVPEGWIDATLVRRTQSPFSGLAYGYGWFLSSSGYAIARGYGGQIIAANPTRNLAVAITSDPTRPARSEGYFGDLMRLLDGPILALA